MLLISLQGLLLLAALLLDLLFVIIPARPNQYCVCDQLVHVNIATHQPACQVRRSLLTHWASNCLRLGCAGGLLRLGHRIASRLSLQDRGARPQPLQVLCREHHMALKDDPKGCRFVHDCIHVSAFLPACLPKLARCWLASLSIACLLFFLCIGLPG